MPPFAPGRPGDFSRRTPAARRRLALAAVLAAVCALTSCSRPEGPPAAAADPIGVRQQNFKRIGAANKALGDELKKDAPSMETIKAATSNLARLAPHVSEWFPAGSGPRPGADTAALPAVWRDGDRFTRDADAFETAALALDRAAASGDVGQVRTAASAVGNTCKSCHSAFRAKK